MLISYIHGLEYDSVYDRFLTKKNTEFKDSLIYFVRKHPGPNLFDNLKASSVSQQSSKKQNQIFHLPLKFVSNAKPTDVITGKCFTQIDETF